jgi:ABC-type amino acid transport substrate-binding protein
VDQFATAAVAAAGWPAGSLSAVYDPTEQGGLAKLNSADAVLAFVPYPFYVEHAAQLHLTPLAQADIAGTGTKEKWTLVAKNGRVTGPSSLTGYTIASVAGYSPEFVRHSALSAWEVPANVKIEPVGQILSALRRVASGDQVVVLLDQTQAAALPTLPFASDLKAVVQSPELPVAIVAVVGNRVPAERAKAFQAGLLKMARGAEAADTLGSLKLQGFVMPRLPGNVAKPLTGKRSMAIAKP